MDRCLAPGKRRARLEGALRGVGLTACARQIFEGVVNLLDRLKAWHCSGPGSTELREMARIGLRIITGYIQQQHPQVCAHTTRQVCACAYTQPALSVVCAWCFYFGSAVTDKGCLIIPMSACCFFHRHCWHSSGGGGGCMNSGVELDGVELE